MALILKGLDQLMYLGTYLDDRLNWKAHINYSCQKITLFY